jgi:hypothetical protein
MTNDNDKDGPERQALRVNPEVLKEVSPLPGLNDIQVTLQPASIWVRWIEPIFIHVVASTLFAILAFFAGTIVGGTNESKPVICIPTSAAEDIAE